MSYMYIIIGIVVAYIIYYVLEHYSNEWLNNLIYGKNDKFKKDEEDTK